MTVAAPTLTKVPNYINGRWAESRAGEWIDITNPATGETIAQTPLSDAAEVHAAVEAAAAAFPEWRRTPPEDRIQPLWTRFTGGCHPNRDTEATVAAGGFRIVAETRRAEGVMRRFVARVE